MKKNPGTKEQLLAENEDLRKRLEEAEETLRAIHEGEVDALVVSKPQGEIVFTLKGAEHPYRVFVEAMNEGAATLDPEGTILYCNNRFAEMLKIPADKVIGSSIHRYIPSTDRSGFESAFMGGRQKDTTVDVSFRKDDQELIPVHLSFNMLHGQDMPVVCMVAMDLTEHKRMEEALRQFNADLEKRVEDRTAELINMNETLQVEIVERKQAEEALRRSESRSNLLWETAGQLLTTDNPQETVNELCRDVMEYLDCQVFFNFLADKQSGKLHLNACAGIPENEVKKIEWLDYGVAVCGCAARDGVRIVAEDIGCTPDPRTNLVRSYGVQAYACHPIKVRDRLIGTLSFGTRTRTNFSVEDLALMKTVTDQVATSMERIGLIRELRASRDELELRVHERTSELAKANETLRDLSSRLFNAQENERKRIAGELHDTIGSCLNGVKFKIEETLQQMGKGSYVTEEPIRNVIPVIQEGIEECRRMQQDLRPSLLDDLGLLSTLSWFCRRYQTIYTGIKVELEQALEETDIPHALRTVIYRVIQEGMNNIAKHSKADLVHVSLRKMDGRIEIVLEDNGQGFDLKKVLNSEITKRGLGLTSMRERTQLLGGSFAIESSEGKGTTVRASWPLREEG
jgi:PAS domain S-box-containing protein